MLHFDASSAELTVLTFKEGVLSAMAHDLRIAVRAFDVDVDEATLAIRARIDASSLRVVSAMREGAALPNELGDSDKQKIEHNIRDEVLDVRSFPEIRFASTKVEADGEGYRVEGELTLHGKTQAVSFVARPEGDRMIAEARLHQPSFGIKPYSAMLGALKVKPDVIVRGSLPRASLPSR